MPHLRRKFISVYRYFSSQARSAKEIRNIGIIAHIDAGKTTVTERFLYLAGATRTIGDVDSGNTVTDFLDIERERGITVQSAAVTFNWNNSHINLIDTPGHVDFTLEVERSTRVLDGVVTILDAKAGVQAQTRTVWRQASKFRLPSVFFINKMDKPKIDLEKILESMEEKLNVKGILTIYPLYLGESLHGFIDVLNNKMLKLGAPQWTGPEKAYVDEFLKRKEDICYRLSDINPEFMSIFLDSNEGDSSKITPEQIHHGLYQMYSSRTGAVVSCGSALKCPQSVKPLLDQVVRFLPNAEGEEKKAAEAFGSDFSGLVFKIGHEKRKGQLSYLRLYTGSLKSGQMVYNVNRRGNDGPLRIFVPYGNELEPVSSIKAGDIAVVSGLRNTVTGDTLLANEKSILPNFKADQGHIKKEGSKVFFSGIQVPEPVYFCSIEPPNSASFHEFEKALYQISVEDPSIRTRQDKETGQTIIETMGELHLEIIKDKFQREYGLNVFIGPLQIAYREVISKPVEYTATVSDDQVEGSNHTATMTMLIEPKEDTGKFKRIQLDLPNSAHSPRYEWQKAISEGCINALHNGPVLGSPVQDVQISLKELAVSGGRIHTAVLSACAHKCVTEGLKKAGAHLLEPVMKVEITIEDASQGIEPILQELSKRRARIEHCSHEADNSGKILAQIPLAEMKGLSSDVRILTSGLGSLHVEIDKYVRVSEYDEAAIIAKLSY